MDVGKMLEIQRSDVPNAIKNNKLSRKKVGKTYSERYHLSKFFER